MSGPSRLATAPGAHARSSRERRLSLVEREPFGKDGVVAALQSHGQAGPQRVEGNTALARQVRQVTGAAQQALHAARPVFFLDVDEGGDQRNRAPATQSSLTLRNH